MNAASCTALALAIAILASVGARADSPDSPAARGVDPPTDFYPIMP